MATNANFFVGLLFFCRSIASKDKIPNQLAFFFLGADVLLCRFIAEEKNKKAKD